MSLSGFCRQNVKIKCTKDLITHSEFKAYYSDYPLQNETGRGHTLFLNVFVRVFFVECGIKMYYLQDGVRRTKSGWSGISSAATTS